VLARATLADVEPRVAAVVLAAGQATRFGSAKQLARVGGVTLVQRAIDAGASAGELVVVLGARADEIEPTLRLGPGGRTVRNPDFADGQSTSLRAGVSAVDPGAAAVVVLLADQPGVTEREVRAVVDAFIETGAPLVRASYRGRPGHPVLIARELFPEVMAGSGDQGARSVLARHAELVREVAVDRDPPGDVDTPADLIAQSSNPEGTVARTEPSDSRARPVRS
jgi:CTP:molybdopterin cytidylyltransferase MocA